MVSGARAELSAPTRPAPWRGFDQWRLACLCWRGGVAPLRRASQPGAHDANSWCSIGSWFERDTRRSRRWRSGRTRRCVAFASLDSCWVWQARHAAIRLSEVRTLCSLLASCCNTLRNRRPSWEASRPDKHKRSFFPVGSLFPAVG